MHNGRDKVGLVLDTSDPNIVTVITATEEKLSIKRTLVSTVIKDTVPTSLAKLAAKMKK